MNSEQDRLLRESALALYLKESLPSSGVYHIDPLKDPQCFLVTLRAAEEQRYYRICVGLAEKQLAALRATRQDLAALPAKWLWRWLPVSAGFPTPEKVALLQKYYAEQHETHLLSQLLFTLVPANIRAEMLDSLVQKRGIDACICRLVPCARARLTESLDRSCHAFKFEGTVYDIFFIPPTSLLSLSPSFP